MDMRKFTEKSVNALQDAQSVAKEYGNQEIGQVHLLYSLVSADEGLIPQLLKKMEIDLSALQSAAQAEIAARSESDRRRTIFILGFGGGARQPRKNRRRKWGTAISPSNISFTGLPKNRTDGEKAV